MEEWRDVIGYEGIYQVSSYGNVRSLDRVIIRKNGHPMTIKGRLLSDCEDSQTYGNIHLYKDGVRKREYVHRLVAQAFLPNPDNLPCVDHVNGDKKDNRASNLRWVSFYENSENRPSYRQALDKIKELEQRIVELEEMLDEFK